MKNKLFAGYDTKKKLLVTYDIAELVKDRERLDWVLSDAGKYWLSLREDIDKEMEDADD